jgi:hypothetical protein
MYKIPAGAYYLGDPCYVVRDGEWGGLLDMTDCFDNPEGFLSDGTRVVAFGTYYGDGEYYDQFGRDYGVDAGLIGLVPWSDSFAGAGGHKVEFDKDVFAHEDDGILTFGNIVIDTKGQYEDDEDSGYEEDDEDGSW